jgi:hypothetical protein
MKNQKRFVIRAALTFSSLLMLIISAQGLASETRMDVLRYNGGAADETLVFTFPGQLSHYNLALAELGTSADTKAYGAAMTTVSDFHIGAAVSRTDWLFTNGMLSHNVNAARNASLSLLDSYEVAMQSSSGTATQALYAPTRPFELMAAVDLSGSTLGFRLAFADFKNKSSSTTSNVTTEGSKTAQQYELGIGYSMPSMDIGLTLSPGLSQKVSDSSGPTESSTNVKGTSQRVDFRWVATENANSPYARAMISQRSAKVSGISGGKEFSSKFTDQIVSVEGGYCAVTAQDGPKLFAGTELMQSSSKGPTIAGVGSAAVPSYTSNDESAKINANVLSGTLAGEFDAAWGLGMMAGMHYILFGDITVKDNTSNKDSKVVQSFPETSDASLWSLGVYYKAKALRLDAAYEKKLLHNGPNFISGAKTEPMLTRISGSYSF